MFLKRRNLCEKWLRMMGSRMKQYGVWFVLLVAAQRQVLEQICQGASTGFTTHTRASYTTWTFHMHVLLTA